MKRIFAAFFAALFVTLTLTSTASAAPALSAASAILVDAKTGRVLYAQNADEERPIASITKLMTALVAVESTEDLSRVVTVKREYTLTEGSSMYLKVGETLTLEELLYGLLLVSGNDAALAVAGFCGGDVETFVGWMNEKAAELGMTHSHFANPSGLPAEGHYSTAADMAKVAQAVLKHEVLAKICATKSITLGTRTLSNHNKLLWNYEGCIGMKTGYTDAAGRTLVSAAQRGQQQLVVVTLNDRDDWRDHAALFDYGFQNWPSGVLCTAGKNFRVIPVTGSLVRGVRVCTESDVYYPLMADERVKALIELPDSVEAPVRAGTIAGSLTFTLDGREIGSTYLTYERDVERDASVEEKGPIDSILDFFKIGRAGAFVARFGMR